MSSLSEPLKTSAIRDGTTSQNFPEDLGNYEFVMMKFDKYFKFANRETEMDYRSQYDSFVRNNQYRDLCFKHGANYMLDNFKAKVLAINSNRHSCGTKTGMFLFVSLMLLMSWPYRMWMEGLCYRGQYTFTKVLTL